MSKWVCWAVLALTWIAAACSDGGNAASAAEPQAGSQGGTVSGSGGAGVSAGSGGGAGAASTSGTGGETGAGTSAGTGGARENAAGGGAAGAGPAGASAGGAAGAGTGSGAGAGRGSAGTGGTSGAGASGTGAGAGGGTTATPSDPCAGFPPNCVELCEGGLCECSCPNLRPCPEEAPTEDTECNTAELCGYGEPSCHRIFECFQAAWRKTSDTCADAPSGSCPATLDEAMATACLERRCGYDDRICSCGVQGCSGVAREPYTYCEGPPPAACLGPLTGRCLQEGLHCGSSCCGVQTTCTDGEWTSAMAPCPP